MTQHNAANQGGYGGPGGTATQAPPNQFQLTQQQFRALQEKKDDPKTTLTQRRGIESVMLFGRANWGNTKERDQIANYIAPEGTITRETVQTWLDAYQSGGIDQLMNVAR